MCELKRGGNGVVEREIVEVVDGVGVVGKERRRREVRIIHFMYSLYLIFTYLDFDPFCIPLVTTINPACLFPLTLI